MTTSTSENDRIKTDEIAQKNNTTDEIALKNNTTDEIAQKNTTAAVPNEKVNANTSSAILSSLKELIVVLLWFEAITIYVRCLY